MFNAISGVFSDIAIADKRTDPSENLRLSMVLVSRFRCHLAVTTVLIDFFDILSV